MNPAQVTPALAGSERDGDGRLVKLIYDSTPPLKAPDVNPWLVAVDGSDNALRAVAHVAGQAPEMNACALHLVHVQPWLSKEAAGAELAHRALEATAQARALLDTKGLPWRLHVAMGDPAERILEEAVRLKRHRHRHRQPRPQHRRKPAARVRGPQGHAPRPLAGDGGAVRDGAPGLLSVPADAAPSASAFFLRNPKGD